MHKKTVKLCSILCASSLLSGCWDQEPLREARLAYSIGFDITEENQLQQTVELVRSSGSEQSSFENEIHSATGHNIRDTSDTLKENVTGNIRYFKYGLQLLGTKIQKKGIFPFLDISFRDPTNPTALVKLISVDGETAEILKKKESRKFTNWRFPKEKSEKFRRYECVPKGNFRNSCYKNVRSG